MLKQIAIFLIILGVIFTAIGGIMDMTGKSNISNISKSHFWHDGTYVTELAIALLLINYYNK